MKLYRTLEMIDKSEFEAWFERGASNDDDYYVKVWKDKIDSLDDRLRRCLKTRAILKELNRLLFDRKYQDDFMELISINMLCTEEEHEVLERYFGSDMEFIDMVTVTLFHALNGETLPLKKEVFAWRGSNKLDEEQKTEKLAMLIRQSKRISISRDFFLGKFRRRKDKKYILRILAKIMLSTKEEKVNCSNYKNIILMQANYISNKLSGGRVRMKDEDLKVKL